VSTPEMLWLVVFIASLAFLLIGHSIFVSYKINIFLSIFQWIKTRTIIISSAVFLIAPFLVARISVASSNQPEALAGIDFEWLWQGLTTATALIVANRSLDHLRKNEERKKAASLLVLSLQEHLKMFDALHEPLQKSWTKEDKTFINKQVQSTLKTNIYQDAISKISSLA
jgi:hypothetical protein